MENKIRSVDDLNDYIEFTQDIIGGQYKDVQILCNLSTILSLKKIRSLEVEYFNKCEGSGAAFRIFERMLYNPASNFEGRLGFEVIGHIQYWLDAVRKHLISHHIHWWMFLRQILLFIKELRLKDSNLNNILVQELAESMLDLATSNKPDVSQRYEILHTFNLFCAESSRETRQALQRQFEPYFIRLAMVIATCGHLASQIAALEALLRWLQPRYDPRTRRAAARTWFQPHVYPKAAVDVFLDRNWMDFFKDARDFLNSLNEPNNLITSVFCKKLSVGDTIVISGAEKRQYWLDINSGSQSITVVLHPDVLAALGASNAACMETLSIDKHSARLVKLYRESNEVILSIETLSPPSIIPSRVEVLTQQCDVIAVLSSRSNMPRVDAALRTVFEDKYLGTSAASTPGKRRRAATEMCSPVLRVPLERGWKRELVFRAAPDARSARTADVYYYTPEGKKLRSTREVQGHLSGTGLTLENFSFYKESLGLDDPEKEIIRDAKPRTPRGSSPEPATPESPPAKIKEENTWISYVNTEKDKRRRSQSGVAGSKICSDPQSPSTTSTRSLAQLHEKLVNLPYCEFTKEHERVVARTPPTLATLSEHSETQRSITPDHCINSNSTFKLRPCGYQNFVRAQDNKSKSDTEVTSKILEAVPAQNEENRSSLCQSEKYLRKNIDDENITSLFSADNSIINATIEHQPKDIEINTDHLADLLVQEALLSKANKENERASDSGINTGNVKSQEQIIQDSETIEDTQYNRLTTSTKTPARRRNKKNKNVTKSTSDESNTESIIETPISFVSVRKRNQRITSVSKKNIENTDDTTFDNKEVEEFFSQHFAENQMGDVIISPSLAKKINDSPTSSSNEFLMKDIDDNYFDIRNEELPDLGIVECLNDIVDKVCSDFEKCSEYLDKHSKDAENLNIVKKLKIGSKRKNPLEEKGNSTTKPKQEEIRKPSQNKKNKAKQNLKLKFTVKKQKANPKAKGKLKFVEPVPKMTTIFEDNNENDANKTVTSDAKKITIDNNMETPLARKKRKLYSPKDDEIRIYRSNSDDSSKKADRDYDDDIALSDLKTDKDVTPKPSSSCYKEIEKERKNYKRIRVQKLNNVESPLSPKTKRLDDVFEKLKDNIEVHKNEKIILVDKKSDKDVRIYNFTSDSEDEDFKQKKIEVQKRTSTTTIGSGTSIISTRRGRAKKKPSRYIEDGSDSDNETVKPAKRKRAAKRKVSKANKQLTLKVDRPTNLIDEKMREVPPVELSTSFDAAIVDNIEKAPEPFIKPPELEAIPDENIDVKGCREKVTQKQKTYKKQNNKEAIKDEFAPAKKQDEKKVTKKGTKINKNAAKNPAKDTILKVDDRTISPLPGLVIETEIDRNEVEDSITTNVVRKIQKIYKEGPDAFNETITTQNMLSENEKGKSSPHLNITKEIGKIFGDDSSSNSKKNKELKTSDIEYKENSDANIIDDTINSDQALKITKAEKLKSKKQSKLTLKHKDKTDSSVNSTSAKEHLATKTKNIKSNSQQINESQKSKTKSIKSHIDNNYDDLIYIHTEIVTRSISKRRSRSQEIEIDNITSDSQVNSERSIATDGITGHGDMNEFPPSPKLLRENLSPREIQDMDPTIRQYYIELSSKVNISNESSKNQKNIDEKVKTKAMKRVLEDSDSELIQKSDKTKRHNFENREYDLARMLPSRRETESESSYQTSKKSPTVSISRLSSKEISQWLPSMKITSESKAVKQSIRTAKNMSKETTVESSFETAEKTQETLETSPRVVINRKSQISPIKLEEFRIKRKILPKNISKDESRDTQNNEMVSTPDSIDRNYFIRLTHESSLISSAATEVLALRTVSKRKSPVAEPVDDAKKRKLGENIETIDISESRQSSNVKDWLRTNTSTTSEVDNSDATRDVLQNLMEKLDTTLGEIHQNTTKDFINLFVDAQKQLSEAKEERRKMYRETLSTVTRLIDQKFAQMDEQAEEQSDNFIMLLKTRAVEVLRRDCSRKRVMISILREDVQAVHDHLANNQG